MKIYLLDTENLSSDEMLKICEQASDNDIVYAFCTLAGMLRFSKLSAINEQWHKIRLIKCFSGNCALDFQLSSYLGLLIQKHGINTEYIICSHDTDFNPLFPFWMEQGYTVSKENISVAKKDNEGSNTAADSKTRTETIKKIKGFGYTDEQAENMLSKVIGSGITPDNKDFDSKLGSVLKDLYAKSSDDDRKAIRTLFKQIL